VEIPEELAQELEKIAEAKGISIAGLVSVLAWNKYVKGDYRETYAKAWKYLIR
jgi:hypothetical protein